MNASKFVSNYLKGASVKKPVAVTVSSVEMVEFKKDGEEAKKEALVIYFAELEQALVTNKTILTFLIDQTGTDETDDWIGKKFELYFDPNVFYASKKVGGLRLRPVTK